MTKPSQGLLISLLLTVLLAAVALNACIFMAGCAHTTPVAPAYSCHTDTECYAECIKRGEEVCE